MVYLVDDEYVVVCLSTRDTKRPRPIQDDGRERLEVLHDKEIFDSSLGSQPKNIL